MQKNGTFSIFSFKYWQAAAAEFKSLRSITFAALVIALSIVIGSLFIPVGESLRIKFSFLVISVGAMIYGPVVATVAGAASDVVGYLMFPSGVFFPGYTLSAMLGAFIYGLFLYRTRITVLKILLAKFLVNFVVNVGLGSLWSAMMFGKGYIYYFAKSIIKNTLMLPIEVIMLVVLLQLLLPILMRLKLVPEQESKRIKLF